ncbi:EamA family transporter [Fortiea contorta]|uniref:EamA family transporter n=1 Tax=Fortiea contorta TaxID=1892405 RepID=UPI00034512E0|nr:EamA family transporter [Fortiea contorta]
MTPQEFSLLLISVIISVAGQFFLKLGALKLGKINAENVILQILSIVTIPELLIGLTCYALGAVAYILLLIKVNLSVAAPAVAIGYVFSVLLGCLVLKEPVPLIRLIGLCFIVTGVILVVWKK